MGLENLPSPLASVLSDEKDLPPTRNISNPSIGGVTPEAAAGAFKFVGFNDFEEKRKKSVADILLATSK